jgi:N-acetylneuraminic acid mutarotase
MKTEKKMALYKNIIIALIIVPTLILAQKNNWQVVGKMPRPVYGGEAIVHDSLIYIFGGKDSLDRVINDIQTYNPRNQQWKRVGKMQQNRYGFVLDKLNDTSIVACGGVWENTERVNSIEKWDFPSYDTEQNKIINFNENFNRIFSSGHIYENRLYLFGGMSSTAAPDITLPFIVVYDLQSQNFETLEDSLYHNGDIPYHHISVRVANKIYLFGGVRFVISNRILIFDLVSEKLNTISSFIDVRAGGKAVFWKDGIFLIGGYDELSNVLNSTDIFYLDSRQTTRGPGLNYNRQELMTVVYDDAIYVFGGKDVYNQTVPWIEKLDLLYLTIIEQPSLETIHTFLLLDNYPNPFNGTTIIPFTLAKSQTIRLDIFSISGQHIQTLVNDFYSAGCYTIKWDGTDSHGRSVASSVYIYQLQSGQDISAKKMILLR